MTTNATSFQEMLNNLIETNNVNVLRTEGLATRFMQVLGKHEHFHAVIVDVTYCYYLLFFNCDSTDLLIDMKLQIKQQRRNDRSERETTDQLAQVEAYLKGHAVLYLEHNEEPISSNATFRAFDLNEVS